MVGRRLGGRVGVVLLAAGIGGCALFNRAPNLPCPRAVVLADAKKVTEFREGPGRDVTDVRFEGEIAGLVTTCEYNEDGFVDVDVSFALVALRGPAAERDVGHFNYFVAIADAGGNVLARRAFAVDVEFAERQRRAAIQEDLTQHIPLNRLDDGPGHRIFVGFELTREQLDYVRRRRS